MIRTGPLRRKTPIKADPALAKRRPRKGLKPIPLSARRAVAARSGGVCEACGAAAASHVHHRKLRSQGGDNSPENLLHLCAGPGGCHGRIHASPLRSYELGLLVRSTDDPATVAVKGWV